MFYFVMHVNDGEHFYECGCLCTWVDQRAKCWEGFEVHCVAPLKSSTALHLTGDEVALSRDPSRSADLSENPHHLMAQKHTFILFKASSLSQI